MKAHWTFPGSLVLEDADGPIATVKFAAGWRGRRAVEKQAALLRVLLDPDLCDPQERVVLWFLLSVGSAAGRSGGGHSAPATTEPDRDGRTSASGVAPNLSLFWATQGDPAARKA